MRVSEEKTTIFKEGVEYLGFIVTRNGAKTDPEKVEAIQEFAEPKKLVCSEHFFGLAS